MIGVVQAQNKLTLSIKNQRASLSSSDCECGVPDLHCGEGVSVILLLAHRKLAGRAALKLTLILTNSRGPEKLKIAAQWFALVWISFCLASVKEQPCITVSATEEVCCMGQTPEQSISSPIYSWRKSAEVCKSHPSREREKLCPQGPWYLLSL